MLAAGLAMGGAPAQEPAADDAGRIEFDIPAQPLSSALDAYGERTGLGILIDTGNGDRTASAVSGRYTPAEAITRMLAGTGLHARIVDREVVVIAPAGGDAIATDSAPVADAAAGYAAGQAFLADIQRHVIGTLCRSTLTRPGNYRLAMELTIDRHGEVLRTHLLGSSGNPQRDIAIVDALEHSTMKAPAGTLAGPLTLLLLPDGQGLATQCPAAAAGRG